MSGTNGPKLYESLSYAFNAFSTNCENASFLLSVLIVLTFLTLSNWPPSLIPNSFTGRAAFFTREFTTGLKIFGAYGIVAQVGVIHSQLASPKLATSMPGLKRKEVLRVYYEACLVCRSAIQTLSGQLNGNQNRCAMRNNLGYECRALF